MIVISIAGIALAVAAPLVAAGPSRAAGALPLSGVGQHATVLNDIRQAQRRNNAAIGHVQNDIRSTRPKTY